MTFKMTKLQNTSQKEIIHLPLNERFTKFGATALAVVSLLSLLQGCGGAIEDGGETADVQALSAPSPANFPCAVSYTVTAPNPGPGSASTSQANIGTPQSENACALWCEREVVANGISAGQTLVNPSCTFNNTTAPIYCQLTYDSHGIPVFWASSTSTQAQCASACAAAAAPNVVGMTGALCTYAGSNQVYNQYGGATQASTNGIPTPASACGSINGQRLTAAQLKADWLLNEACALGTPGVATQTGVGNGTFTYSWTCSAGSTSAACALTLIGDGGGSGSGSGK